MLIIDSVDDMLRILPDRLNNISSKYRLKINKNNPIIIPEREKQING